ncbi:MAG: class I SAM-dependent methyltransferase [Candidatus Omnitrophica bacterium]|nr:class I SAM-dependent methyltransferase [Candidatus Omnitrophota bacterium]
MKNIVTPEKTLQHAELLSNRVRKQFRHLSKRFKKQNIDCFRLYDWDIPEVRAVVDKYGDHLVVGEYIRLQTGTDWLPKMAEAVAAALEIPKEKVHIKKRTTNTKGGERYQKLDTKDLLFIVHERDLKFWVNLDDYIDTGLFSDHRDTRLIVRDLAKDKDFLNLYAYTGTFTCAAASGNARSSVTVDRNSTYLKWAKDNMELNKLMHKDHEFIQSDSYEYLHRAYKEGRRFNLAVIDPPSFSQDHQEDVSFDINREHPVLIKKVLNVMHPGSVVFFSTNHQRFEPRLQGLNVSEIKELTPKTIPEDYRNKTIHRCWRMIKA